MPGSAVSIDFAAMPELTSSVSVKNHYSIFALTSDIKAKLECQPLFAAHCSNTRRAMVGQDGEMQSTECAS